MNLKLLSCILLGLLTIFLISLVLAASFSTSTSSIALTQGVNSTTFTISSANSTNLSLVPSINYPDGIAMPVTVNPSPIVSNSTAQTITLISSIDYTKLKLGKTYSGSILISNQNVPTDNSSVTINVQKSFCDFGQKGSALRITRIADQKLDNEDAWEWRLLDDIEIEVRVENTLDDEIDAILEYKLIDSDGNEVDLDQDEIDITIGDDDSEEVTITFQIPVDDSALDFSSSSKDFKFYVKLYEDGNEDEQCTNNKYSSSDLFESVRIEKESRDVVVNDLQLQDSANCGDSLSLSGTVYNVGYKDENRVKVTLANKELGINLEQEFKNLDSGDSEDFNFDFTIPKNATEKTYELQLRTFFDYDKSSERYDEGSEYFTRTIKVQGNCVKPVTKNALLTIASGQLEDIKAGKEITIKATLKNTGEEATSYVVSLAGYESFASVTSIEPTTTILAPGISQDITIVLKLNSDAEGEKVFNIKASFDGQEKKQAVSLSISKPSGILTGLAISETLRGNWFIWVIVLINVILIVAIIIVAVRMARS